MSLRFYLALSDVDPGNEDFICKSLVAKIWVEISSFILSI